jgi:DNA-binding NtrC family response regulator
MRKILVVDDQDCVRQLIREELQDVGYDVITALDAQSLMEELRTGAFDLVVLDLFLDGRQGWELLESVKAARPELPVVVFTAYDTFREDPRLEDASAYIVKSMDLEPLKTAISEVIDRCSASRELSEVTNRRALAVYEPVV